MKYTPPVGQETEGESAHYINGNPELGILGSPVPAEAVEHPQREIVEVIKKAGLDPDGDDLTQLWQAIGQIISTKAPIATKKKPGLVQIGDGLAITPQGLLSVLIASTSQAGLVKPRYGLKIGKDGSLDVDFGDMPTDKFEELLKSIRVPIWLTKNKNFYVNGTTGSDTLDDGRGESEGKPFKTIQAAVNYACDNYNLSRYDANIIIADGTYETGVFELPQYSATTGTLRLTGTTITSRDSVIIKGCVFTSAGNSYILQNLTIDQADVYSHGYAVLSELGRIDLYNVVIDASDTTVTSGSLFMIRAEGGTVRVWSSSVEGLPGIVIKVPESCNGYLYASNGGRFYFSADIAIQNNGTMTQGGVFSSNGIIQRQTSNLPYPGRLAVVTTSGTLTGRRYIANLNGIIDSIGGGAEFFPGSVAGVTETGGQYA